MKALIQRLALLIGLIALTLAWSPITHAAPVLDDAVVTQDFTVDFGDFTSKAQLSYPKAARGGSPTMIMIHGGCPCDMDEAFINPDGSVQSHIFKDIADYLAPRGVAVLRYNKHYITSATEVDFDKFGKLTFQQMLDDAERVLAAAKRNPHIDPKRIYIYGWSEGTIIAAALITRHPELAGLIVQGVAASPYRASLIDPDLDVALPYLLSFSADGKITADTLKQAQAGNGGVIKYLLGDFIDPATQQGDTPAVNPLLDTNKDGVLDPDSEIKPGIGAVVDAALAPGGPSSNYGPGRALPNVADQAPNLKLPVLILQGENDVFSVQDGAKLDAALAANPDHTLKTYPGLGHSLGPAASRIDDAFRPITNQPLADLSVWVLSHSSKPATLPRTGADDAPAFVWLIGIALVLIAMGAALGGRTARGETQRFH
ncbi:MAG: dienelactone hydrolase family protein [Roseiflexaceae bacterium]